MLELIDQKYRKRFWGKVDIKNERECWNWKASTSNQGYGQFIVRVDKKTYALSCHRLAYSFVYGEIPNGLFVCHRCDNKICCNPEHLFIGTNQDNVDDKMKKGRHKTNTEKVRGENNPKAKLTELDIMKIRNYYANGEYNSVQLGKMFKVCQVNISSIIRRQTWKNVP